MRDGRSKILRHITHAPGLFTLVCESPEFSRSARPGNFAMIGMEGRSEPFLRRAFSIADRDAASGTVEFLIKSVGAGTRCLEELPPGSEVSILAPLGNEFSCDDLSPGDRVAIVAGGVGVAPFPLLLRALSGRGIVADLFFGGRSTADLSYREKISPLSNGEEFDVTEDGSTGTKGRVTEVVKRRLENGAAYRRLYACGPTPMFVSLARIVEEFSLSAEFSTEASMGCGFGVCLACVIPKSGGGYLISCREGPILDPRRVDWGKC